jgi:hypothetical protein
MKKLLFSVLLLSVSALIASDVTGLWVGKGSKADPKYGMIPSNFQIGITQAGSKITGFMMRDKHDAVKFTSGAISGNQITISYSEGTSLFTGQLSVSGTQVTGRLTSSAGEVYLFSATKK